VEVEYLRHGVPLADYQLSKADHRRQHEAVQAHEWIQCQLANAPSWPDEHWERMTDLLGSPAPLWERHRWRLRLYCGHIIETTRLRSSPRPDQSVCDKEHCPECGLDPAVIVTFEPLGPAAHPPPENRSAKPSGPTQPPPAHQRSKAELVAENYALRAELEELRRSKGT
jgi:hypothetical protein